jgi:hypothetical protein
LCERAPHLFRRIGTDDYDRSDLKTKDVLQLGLLGMDPLQQLGFQLLEPVQLLWRQLIFGYEVRFALKRSLGTEEAGVPANPLHRWCLGISARFPRAQRRARDSSLRTESFGQLRLSYFPIWPSEFPHIAKCARESVGLGTVEAASHLSFEQWTTSALQYDSSIASAVDSKLRSSRACVPRSRIR